MVHTTRAIFVTVGTVTLGGAVSVSTIPAIPILAGLAIICGTTVAVKYLASNKPTK